MAWTVATSPAAFTSGSVSWTTKALNNVVCLTVLVNSGSTTITASGGNVTTWNYFGTTHALSQSTGFSTRIAWGQVTTVGTATITVTATAGTVQNVDAAEFTPPVGTTSVTQDGTQGTNSGTATTSTFPSLTPTGATDLFWGYGVPKGEFLAGSTTGFTYFDDPNNFCVVVYSLAAPNPSAPTWTTQFSAGWDNSDGLLIPSGGAAAFAPKSLAVLQAGNRAGAF